MNMSNTSGRDMLCKTTWIGHREWICLWGMIVVGHLTALIIDGGVKSLRVLSFVDMLGVVLLPLTAIITAAIGPLAIVCFVLFLFRIRGGTPTAICSLLLGSSFFYCVLICGIRIHMKVERPLVRWFGRIGILCYSCLATFCLLYIASRM